MGSPKFHASLKRICPVAAPFLLRNHRGLVSARGHLYMRTQCSIGYHDDLASTMCLCGYCVRVLVCRSARHARQVAACCTLVVPALVWTFLGQTCPEQVRSNSRLARHTDGSPTARRERADVGKALRYGQFSTVQSGKMGPAPGRLEPSKGILK